MKKKKTNQEEQWKRYTVVEKTTLLPYLQQALSHLSRNAVKSILTKGKVEVDGEIITQHNQPLYKGQIVTIRKEGKASTSLLRGLTILYEDDDVIVVVKASGLLSIASGKEANNTAYRQLSNYVKGKHPRNRIFIVHRLDRDTSGVMMFAKSEQVKKKLQDRWKDIVKKRTYVALVEGVLKQPTGTITSWLKETKTHLMYASDKPNGGKKAITHYQVLQSNGPYSLIELELETGRKNQIRVHMQQIGHPIAGDKKYGASTNPLKRLGLHAKELTFKHPRTGKVLQFESSVPSQFGKEVKGK
ncbi:RluA family pseudouridine synthase [Pontibacillus litoralis]|uniref:Pseudouridine synthase n=1 Tax=Pontibacillus litoralis JSM 072002 TaxID=1385512 RepID=A0A0A5G9A6_9BACI|nr:RluA family pseudouridine synthase [Pontibacillus litoralis]KGX87695.1 RNA pseudouridylate synthase [Pontibacillus litoralis JSM 072002]